MKIAVTNSGVVASGESEVMLYEPPEAFAAAFPTVIDMDDPSADPDADSSCAV